MARFLHWGAGVSSSQDISVPRLLQSLEESKPLCLDRWKLTINPPPKGTTAFGTSNEAIFCNYFSIGIDSQVVAAHEGCRESCSCVFCHQNMSKLLYGCCGFFHIFCCKRVQSS